MAERVVFDTATTTQYQQTCSGTGNFTGVETGRASLTLGIGNAAVIVRAWYLGAYANNFVVRLVEPGMDTAVELVSLERTGALVTVLTVILRKVGGVVTSTSAQVAAAVQAFMRADRPQRYFERLTATYGGNGAGTVVPAAGVLAGGIDPVVWPDGREFSLANLNGGLFNFGQTQSVLLRSFESRLAGATAWTLELVSFDEGLRERDAVTLASGNSTNIALWDMNLPILPLQCLRFIAANTGTVRVKVHEEPVFPRR